MDEREEDHRRTAEELAEAGLTDFNVITSTLGNAFFSGLPFDKLWDCVIISENRDELDAAVSATIRLEELTTKGTIL